MNHKLYMQRCLELARNGLGSASPNPMVGSVIVWRNQIIGEGWHHRAGEPHAEVNAITSVKNKDLLNESTLYVNLEPCSHHGRTPPCADLIISHSIPKVVIANKDPHQAVAGKGIERLRIAGVEVIDGVLKEEGRWLNRRFFCRHELGRPYVILKWAQTRDGFMDRDRASDDIGINWISQPESQSLVHQWRAQEDAIMIGNQTLVNDNPSLTTRYFKGSNPLPIVISAAGKQLPVNAELMNNPKLHIITTNKDLQLPQGTVHVLEAADQHPQAWLEVLNELDILSVIVEGGSKLIHSFIDADLWDEARVLTGITDFGTGLKAPQLPIVPVDERHFGRDLLKLYLK
jgi:diaminohydroxyphosphoribosylaminopyrimidine deaminase/5-amino-6-(5-phosphoribosylamino)uracil reductase